MLLTNPIEFLISLRPNGQIIYYNDIHAVYNNAR